MVDPRILIIPADTMFAILWNSDGKNSSMINKWDFIDGVLAKMTMNAGFTFIINRCHWLIKRENYRN